MCVCVCVQNFVALPPPLLDVAFFSFSFLCSIYLCIYLSYIINISRKGRLLRKLTPVPVCVEPQAVCVCVYVHVCMFVYMYCRKFHDLNFFEIPAFSLIVLIGRVALVLTVL
jgi:hypothetical protein